MLCAFDITANAQNAVFVRMPRQKVSTSLPHGVLPLLEHVPLRNKALARTLLRQSNMIHQQSSTGAQLVGKFRGLLCIIVAGNAARLTELGTGWS